MHMTPSMTMHNYIKLTFQIKKAAVDSFAPGKRIPECVLVLHWTNTDQPPKYLMHKVPLLGASDQEYFMLYIEDSGTNLLCICSTKKELA